jgi:hypothetical protein
MTLFLFVSFFMSFSLLFLLSLPKKESHKPFPKYKSKRDEYVPNEFIKQESEKSQEKPVWVL